LAVRPILTLPHPILRTVCAAARAPAEAWAGVIRDLWDTLDSHVGVGIAAPQIGENVRIVAVDASRAKRPVPNHGRLTLVNPVIVQREGRISFREGCLSVPDYVAHVERAAHIVVSAWDARGTPVSFAAEGFEAVVIQHEIDHLDGVLFIDRVRRARDLKPRPLS